jgi:preprotein translocase subunit SecB
MAESQQPQTGAQGAAPAAEQPVFTIERVYIKDLSIENPGAPRSFLSQDQPQVEIGLQTRAEQIDEGLFESVLTVTVTAKIADKTLFLVEAAQAGLFQIRGIGMPELQPVLGVHCPNILFPFVREAISSAIQRAGFPPVNLAPINFEALYQQQLAEMQRQQGAAAARPN